MKILLLLQVSFITILVMLSMISSNYFSGQCLEDQKSLLIKFKNDLTFDSSVSTKLVMWNENNTDCCQWPGVVCDEEGYVLVLELDHEAISGGIKNSSRLFDLQYLKKLNLAFNVLYVPIPTDIYKLANLTYLNLSHASFNGQIPMELSSLTKLEILDLSGGNLKLERPDLKTLIRNLANLRELYLDRVNVSLKGSEWCSALSSSLPQLRVLSMRDCKISGPLDPILLNLRFLSVICLDYNYLSTMVPDFLADFTKLTALSVRWCYLFGPFPSKIFQVPTLQQLDLSGNENLTGTLPEFPHKTALREVVLSYTGFTSSLPDSIANLRNLTQLELGSCNFTGDIPSKMGNLTELVHLDLSFNSFTGSIPLFHKAKKLNHIDLSNNNGPLSSAQTQLAVLLSLPKLQFLSVKNSHLSGEIHEFSNASSSVLETLDLSNNHLNGSIPRSIFELNRLSQLFLFSNSFSGTIVKGLPRLTTLDLSNNKIEGKIPSWVWTVGNLNLSHNLLESLEKPYHISNTSIVIDLSSNRIKGNIPILPTSLTYFSLANNEFTGSIPSSICSLDKLQFLDMSNNKLSGIIPDTFPLNCNLRTLDLSSNMLEGKVPSSLQRCEPLQVLNIGNNKIKDTFPCMLNKLYSLRVLVIRSNKFWGNLHCPIADQIWPMIQIIDIASNNFQEEILETLGNLKSLIHLNFSHNVLTGRIPKALGNLSLLESLDFSVNQLSGRIPDELASLTFLSFLNLSYNHLCGRIPSGNQLQMFSANSFEGNTGLCDFPLKKTCSDTEDEIDGKYISFALGSSVGFGIIIWLLLHSQRYNDLLDRLLFRILGQHKKKRKNNNPR